jgi:hypothetical protein
MHVPGESSISVASCAQVLCARTITSGPRDNAHAGKCAAQWPQDVRVCDIGICAVGS